LISLFSFEFTYAELALLSLVPILIGMSKTGIHGAGMVAIPLLAIHFGGKLSSGIMLPILCVADVFAVTYYHRHADWSHLKRLLPWATLGVLIGTLTGQFIDDETFKTVMAGVIFVSLGIMIWQEQSSKQNIPNSTWFAILLGVLGGFTTMVGNLAGSVMALYLLSMRLPKNQFIGTAAWFFMIINLFKVPFHIYVWETITLNTFWLDLITIPLVAAGAFLGVKVVKQIPESSYRWFIIGSTAIAAILMIF